MPMDHAEKAVVICDSKGRWPACVYQAGQQPFYLFLIPYVQSFPRY